jgi:hypothetical protein
MEGTRAVAEREPRPIVVGLGPLLWFSAIAIVVTAPLLGRGYLLLLDYPSGPEFPHVPVFPLPSSGDVGNSTPLLALLALFRRVSVYLPDKVLLIAPFVLGGVGLYRLVRSRFGVAAPAALYGATLFVVNPFVADRYLAGHLFFLLALAMLPWALGPLLDLLEEPTTRTAIHVGLWLFGLAIVDLHVAGMYAMLVVIAGIVRWATIVSLAGAGALCAYWLFPSLFGLSGWRIGGSDLAEYASRPAGPRVLPTLAGLYGFWREEFAGPVQRMPLFSLLLIPILALALTGAIRTLATPKHRRAGTTLIVAAVLGLLLAAGTSFAPTAGVFRWVFDHVPLFRIYREPQKFLALVVLAYAVFGAVGLQYVLVRGRFSGRAREWGAAILAIGVVVAYAYTMLFGLWGQVRLSQYPSDWQRANQAIAAAGPGRVLVLPWHLYAVWSFSGDRIVANPAPSFFSREVIAGDNVGFRRIPTQSVDPFSDWVQEILAHRDQVEDLGHLVAPLDVRFVILLHEVDANTYGFLQHQSDLLSVYRGPSLELFENSAWRGPTLALAPAPAAGSSSDAWDGAAAADTFLPEPPRAPQAPTGSLLRWARILPGWRSVAPAPMPYVSTGDRCTDGWKLGGDASLCDLGAVAAFTSPTQTETLWRPAVGARVTGFLITGFALIGALSYGRWAKRNMERGYPDELGASLRQASHAGRGGG